MMAEQLVSVGDVYWRSSAGFGHHQVPQHVEGVSVRLHRHDLLSCPHLQEAVLIQTHHLGLGPVLAPETHTCAAETQTGVSTRARRHRCVWRRSDSPVHPSAVVQRQQSLRAAQLEVRDEALQQSDRTSDQLIRSECVQVLLQHQVVDADGRVAVAHVEPAACRKHHRRHTETL